MALVQFTAIRARAKIIPGPEIAAALDTYTAAFCAEIVAETQPYPAAPGPPNTYVRTFRLLQSWRVKPLPSVGGSIGYQITNGVQDRWGRYYSGYVHGPSRQTSFHAGNGWENIRDHVDRDEFKAGAQQIISEGTRL